MRDVSFGLQTEKIRGCWPTPSGLHPSKIFSAISGNIWSQLGGKFEAILESFFRVSNNRIIKTEEKGFYAVSFASSPNNGKYSTLFSFLGYKTYSSLARYLNSY